MFIPDTRTAIEKAHDAMDKLRKDRYGLDWYRLDLWGRPLHPSEPAGPTNYTGKRFVEGMARTIAKGVRI